MYISNKLLLMLSLFSIFLISCKIPPEESKDKNIKILNKRNITYDEDIQRDIEDIKNKVIKERGNFFYSKEFNNSERLEKEMKMTFSKGNIKEGNNIALKVFERYRKIYNDTKEKKEQIQYLKDNIEKYLNDAEDNEAYIWIPSEIDEVNNLYFESTKKYKNYDLYGSLEMYTKAFNKAQKTARNAKEERAIKETDERMYKQLKALEAISNLPVYDNNNKLVKPSPWNGEVLINNKKESLNLLDKKEEAYILGKINSPVVIAYEEAKDSNSKMGAKTLELVEKARKLWEQGVASRNVLNLRLANELFLESSKYLKAYQNKAANELYIVKIRDTLWGISKKIYKNPYLWPKIWFVNRQKIQNPDLICEDWKIIIPNK